MGKYEIEDLDPIQRWLYTWGIASLPVLAVVLKNITIDNRFDFLEFGVSGELFLVAIVMVADLWLEVRIIGDKWMRFNINFCIIILVFFSVYLFALAPHKIDRTNKSYIIKNLARESIGCLVYGLIIGSLTFWYISISDEKN